MIKTRYLIGSLIIASLVTACDREQKEFDYMPDMYRTTAFKAQSEDSGTPNGSSQRVPPEGTVPRGFKPYPYSKDEGDKAGRELTNPFKPTTSNLTRGKKIYDTYCIVCHGPKGDGSGFVVPPVARPPSLLSDKIRGWSDGHIFHVITMGQNLMPSYASQIESTDRWFVALYIRALQRAANPTEQDVKELESMKK